MNNLLQTKLLPEEKDIRFFEENGYWVSPKIFSDEQLEKIVEHQEKIYRGEFETGREPVCNWLEGVDNPRALRKTDNSHWSDTKLRAVATDSTIGATAAKLMKADVIRLWHDQLLYKPGRGTGKETANVGWHQDYIYWKNCMEPTLITAWVAFTDVDLSNGCMQVVPRSHKWGLVNVNSFFEQNLEKQQAEMVLPENEVFTTVPLVMKAGQVSFHHAITIHGSGANVTELPRRSMAVHLMTGDTRYQFDPKGQHFNARILNGNEGDLYEGDSWPVLYPYRQHD
ncbi:phytanoyl-CoA dioxygenase family protein [Paenibacillus aceris]|uniref:Ectoine hydroxylase-related dioxygenase (Phytanoyl-CoA dioxygenase family) n=1 Tax=Paenibacillus aceris TaxID=869555 RepID=A0ABS4I1Y9_9BACL|nr:phytanoyl-CoA dioxygenase family protein [Paenibacillus aceris]MBP1964934.1 ectoine hydroxylase-related dioxygenase (phytanoyl-CoA dioxygenase family) [Paenibacillus aceris]NHW35596.1 phytanoyl-CoA dioxygenase family protein [Paenibacillus aceris]